MTTSTRSRPTLSCRCGALSNGRSRSCPFPPPDIGAAIKQPPLRPSLAFPRRTRVFYAPPAETALDAWCDILSQNGSKGGGRTADTPSGRRPRRVGGDIEASTKRKRTSTLPAGPREAPTPDEDAASGDQHQFSARDASVDRRLDSVAAKPELYARAARAAAGQAAEPARARGPARRRARGHGRIAAAAAAATAAALSPNNPLSAAGRRSSHHQRRRRCTSVPQRRPSRPVRAGPHRRRPPAAAASADGLGDGDAPARAINTSDGGRDRDARGSRSHRRGDRRQFLEQEPAVAEGGRGQARGARRVAHAVALQINDVSHGDALPPARGAAPGGAPDGGARARAAPAQEPEPATRRGPIKWPERRERRRPTA